VLGRPVTPLTLIIPYYRNAGMLERQCEEWAKYPEDIRVICVDDASPEPARPIIEAAGARCRLYRILEDKPWNREGARNLGSTVAETDWIMHADIDHILPAESARRLVEFVPHSGSWYRFPRFRKGRADETRNKDPLPRDVPFGKVKPHVDSFVCRRDLYWKAGGYDEDFVGCLGGSRPFLEEMKRLGKLTLLPDSISLHVYTRSEIKDASDWTCSRDGTEFASRLARKIRNGDMRPKNPLRFAWERQI
jgi:hypothetical protein